MERIQEEISQAFHGQKKAIGERGPPGPGTLRWCIIVSSQPTVICIDALDGCVEGIHSGPLIR